MRKTCLRVTQMITAEVVQARAMASQLLRWESRGPGDTDNAMRRLSRRYDLEYGSLWSLRYRAPKRIWADVLTAITAAYEKERCRQLRKLAHETALTEAAAGADRNSVAQARAVLRQAESQALEVVADGAKPVAGRGRG